MEMSTESFVESALRVAERFGVPLVLLAVVIWFMRDAAITLHGTVLVPIVKSHTEFLDSTRETLDEIGISEVAVPGGTEFRFSLRARSFLHNQVRSIVGTLERVGAGAWPPGRVAGALAARDRAECGPVCPPQGLYLVGVGYPLDPFAEVADIGWGASPPARIGSVNR
jgi:tRNA pseudouridine38-40 synthase